MRNPLNFSLGKVPLYVIVPLALIVFFAAKHKDLSNDMIGGLAAMMVSGYMLREIGNEHRYSTVLAEVPSCASSYPQC